MTSINSRIFRCLQLGVDIVEKLFNNTYNRSMRNPRVVGANPTFTTKNMKLEDIPEDHGIRCGGHDYLTVCPHISVRIIYVKKRRHFEYIVGVSLHCNECNKDFRLPIGVN